MTPPSKLLYAAGIDRPDRRACSAEQTWRNCAHRPDPGAQVQALRRSVQAFKALGGGWEVPTDLPLPGPDDFKQARLKPATRRAA